MFHDRAAETVEQNVVFDRTDHVHAAREKMEDALAQRLGQALPARYRLLHDGERGALDACAQARRRLKGRVLSLLCRCDRMEGAGLAIAQYRHATGMTDRLSALRALLRSRAVQSQEALRDFRSRFDGKPLALDKWFALQAQVPSQETLERVQALARDPAFQLRNPNRVQALFGAFARGNPVGFHRPDGAGYRFVAARLTEIDALNPQNAARLAKAFESWRTLEPRRREEAHSVLLDLNGLGMSADLAEVMERMLWEETAGPNG